MKLKDIDIRRTVSDHVRGAHWGYMAAGALALVAGVYGIAQLGIKPVDEPGGPVATASALPVPEAEPIADVAEAENAAAGDVEAAPPPVDRGPLPVIDAADPATRVARPAAIRGIYLNAWAIGSSKKLERLIGVANDTEINAFVMDVKEVGEISYRSGVPLAHEIGAGQRYVPNMRAALDKVKAAGIYPIARIVVFRDPVLASARPEFAVQKVDGTGVWEDTHGHRWVDSFNRDVWDYNIAIAREAIELGFSEIQWDYVRFPDVPQAHMETATWPARNGRTKEDGIREFLQYANERLADLNVPLTADVFGLTVSAGNDMGIGQKWAKMVDVTDALLPMIYPSHYARGSYGISQPNAWPYKTVKTALEHARRRTDGVANAARVIPWLQDFTLGAPRYGPEHVRAQIQAVYDAGYDEWVLWHPGSNYTMEALADANGRAPDLPIPDGDLPPPEPKPVDDGLLGSPVDTTTSGR